VLLLFLFLLSLGAPTMGAHLLSAPAASHPLDANIATLVSSARPHPAGAPPATETWLNLSGYVNQNPSGGYIASMAYDAHDGYLLMFGGDSGTSTSTVSGQTWTYQNGIWSDITSSLNLSPPKRYAAAMAYDAKDNETVLFGGYDGGSTYYADTWVFANGSWKNLTSKLTVHPSGRWRSNMAYDAKDGYVVLFGGTDSSGNPLSDTWKFVGNKWTDLTSTVTGSPLGRYRFTMAYDAADNEVVTFGGCATTVTNCADDSTWTYAAGAWANITPTTSPSARVYSMMTYDPQLRALILFGGSSETGSTTALSDTWAFSGGTWTNLTTTVVSHPPARGYEVMAYDPLGGYIVMTTGISDPSITSGFYSDTFSFGPNIVVWASAQPPAIDLTQSTTIAVNTISSLSGFNYTYTGLPAGCATGNVSSLSCTPTALGNSTVKVVAAVPSGDSGFTNLTISVGPLPQMSSATFSLSTVTVGISTNLTVVASGGTGVLSYSYTGLPSGCGTRNTSVLQCTPTASGVFPVRARVTDQVGGSVALIVNLTVNARTSIVEFHASPNPIDEGQTSLLWANVTGGTSPYTYSWVNLPFGCHSADVQSLSCTPATTGTFNFTARVADHFGVAVVGALNLTVNTLPYILSSGIAPLTTDAGVRVTLYTNVSGGTAPFSYAFSNLPGGCTPAGGAVATCTPTQTGKFEINVTVTDAAGMSISTDVNLTVGADPTVASFTASPHGIDLGQSIRLATVVNGGVAPYLYQYSGLPTGCAGAAGPSILCTPAVAGSPLVTVTVKDAWAVVAKSTLTLYVNASPTIQSLSATPGSLAPGAQLTFAVEGLAGGTPPFSYSYSGLPAGCSSENLSSFSCHPSATGSFSVLVTVGDGAGEQALANASVTVASPGSSSGPAKVFGLSPALAYGLIGLVVVLLVAGVLGALLLRRRSQRASSPPPAEEEAELPPEEEG
jgi:hypothetical protein